MNTDYVVASEYGNKTRITNSDLQSFRFLSRDKDYVSFIYKGKRHEAQILDSDDGVKNLKLVIDNRVINMTLKDELDLLIDQMGLSAVVDEHGGDIFSPMPGLVIKLLVEIGDEVKKGQAVIVLEAMKMENLLQATSDGVIKEIKTKEGNSVTKGDLLVVIE